ncbi:transporter substrate-binding domain-containing protein [Ruegeria arenilitoris]|uniref:transporter substrate-binding domain-containing protein n=1 Tax=Ruegeria arenilitoris TaxID=1173585 RepID=UPI002670BF2D|nr:transporter substrate-binding domain-containing protein [Ruegeria arenilitoris]
MIADKFDTIIASMTITDARSKVVSFSDPNHFNSIRFVAAKGHGLANALPADLKGLITHAIRNRGS